MEPECRAVVYHIYYAECTILNVTAQGLSSDRWFQNRDTVTYVKKCAWGSAGQDSGLSGHSDVVAV